MLKITLAPERSSYTIPVLDQADGQVDLAHKLVCLSYPRVAAILYTSQLIHSIAYWNCQFNIIPTSGAASLDHSPLLWLLNYVLVAVKGMPWLQMEIMCMPSTTF